MAALLVSCSGKEPVYWYDASLSDESATGNVPYYPDKPSDPSDVNPSEGDAPEGYTLVWADEFDSTVKLYQNWIFEHGGTGWGNDEAQYYCEGGVYAPTGEKTAEIGDGTLKISARKITPSASSDDKSYISARMSTKSTWKYGYIEMKAKLPADKGCWSAFWMLPDPEVGNSYVRDPSMTGGELDILEYVPGDDPVNVYFSAHSYNATPEAGKTSGYTDPSDNKFYSYYGKTKVSKPGDWHWYSILWTHEYVKAFCDGVQYYYGPNPDPSVDMVANPNWGFDKPFYLKLNLAMGGSWGGSIDPALTSATYEIDYVRVYQKK